METLGTRIKLKRNEMKLTQQKLADSVGVSKTSIIYWEKDENVPKHDSLMALSALFGVTADWLLTGSGKSDSIPFDNNVDLTKKIPLTGRPIPVISWVAAGSFEPIDTVLACAEIDEWLPPNKDCGPNGYGLIVTGISMSPKFEIDDRIYVNPDIQTFDLATGDLVIVSCLGDTEATFKRLIIEGGNKYLKPLNPNWPDQIIKLTEDCRLVGKVVGLYRKI